MPEEFSDTEWEDAYSSDESVTADDLPPRVDSSQWTRAQYNQLRKQLENEIQSMGKRPLCFTRFPDKAIDSKIRGPLAKALEDPGIMVIITQYNACRLFCDMYKRRWNGGYDPIYIRAFVLWADCYKPVIAMRDGSVRTNIQVWYNKLSSSAHRTEQQECVVCYKPFEDTGDEALPPDYRWCGICGERTCMSCYRKIQDHKVWVRCPNCRTHFDVIMAY